MKTFKIILGMLIFSLFTPTVQATPFSINEQEMNHYLNKTVTINDSLRIPGLFSVDYSLKDLITRIGQNNDSRVEMSGLADMFIRLSDKTYVAKLHLTFDAIPEYNPQEGALYLKQLRILRWSGEPNTVMEQLQSVMPLLSRGIATLLGEIPVYTLDETDMKQMIIKKFARDIKVEKGHIDLIGGIF